MKFRSLISIISISVLLLGTFGSKPLIAYAVENGATEGVEISYKRKYIPKSISSLIVNQDNMTDWIGQELSIEEFPFLYEKSKDLVKKYYPKSNDSSDFIALREEKPFWGTPYYIQTITDTSNSVAAYYGQLKDNKPSGEGIFVNDEGMYIGEFKDGRMDGFGVLLAKQYLAYSILKYSILLNTEVPERKIFDTSIFHYVKYEGYFEEGKYEGKGCAYYSPVEAIQLNTQALKEDTTEFDAKYKEYVTKLLEGLCLGSYTYSPSAIEYPFTTYVSKAYEGEFKDGNLIKGKWYIPFNVIYMDGEFKDENLNGSGTIYYVNNGKIKRTGKFSNGTLDGKGKEYYPNGNVLYEGDYKKGYYDGNGTLYNDDGSVRYSGKFKNGDVG